MKAENQLGPNNKEINAEKSKQIKIFLKACDRYIGRPAVGSISELLI